MEEFILEGNGNYLKIEIVKVFGFPESTSFEGGYDTKSIIEINSDGFKVSSTLYISTGNIFLIYESLLTANKELKGEAQISNYEGNLDCTISYRENGHVVIYGTFKNNNEFDNKLSFHFKSDQSYMQSTLRQLAQIVSKYGRMKGVKQ